MSSLAGKIRDKAAVSNKPFIPDARGHMSLVYKYMSSVTQGYNGICRQEYITNPFGVRHRVIQFTPSDKCQVALLESLARVASIPNLAASDTNIADSMPLSFGVN